MSTTATEKHHFQAEIQQLLDIVIHSLYTDKEIFIRELISNAADACEKVRFLQASGQAVQQPDLPLTIAITADENANTLSFTDTGIGMSHADLVENLGTIAHSGTKAFLRQLAEEKKPDAKLIGKFGVGFYSAFMAAKKVTVFSRSHETDGVGWKWTSEGAGGYETEPAADLPRGTKIILELKDDAKDFTKDWRLQEVIRRYSSFIQFPIELNGKHLNTVQAIWARNKNEIKEEEYNEFYKYAGHDADNPLYRLHFNADAPLAIQALIFVPSRNYERAGFMRAESEVNLYCRKVLIKAHCKELFPEWLRFLKGVVDSEDMPLNISRETMQDSALIQKLNKVLTGRMIKFLEEQAEKDATNYEKFYAEFNKFLKEGVVNDFAHREALGKLLRFESSSLDAGKLTSLAEYVKRMPSDQKEIYCLLAPSRESAMSSPYYEVFKTRKFEVLFHYEPWDEFVVENLHSFDGKNLVLAEKADLTMTEKSSGALPDDQAEALAGWMKEALGTAVNAVKVSKRLSDSPALILDSEHAMTSSMKRILRAAGREDPSGDLMKQDLEINPAHPIITRLNNIRESDAELAKKVAEQVLDNARVAAGLLDDPRTMLTRLNGLLERILSTPGAKTPSA